MIEAERGSLYPRVDISKQGEHQETIDALVKRSLQSENPGQRGAFFHLAGNTAFQGFLAEQEKANNLLLFLRRKEHIQEANLFLFQAGNLFGAVSDCFSEIQGYELQQASALCNRAICLKLLGKGGEAAEDFQRALELSPSDEQRQLLRESGARYSLGTKTLRPSGET